LHEVDWYGFIPEVRTGGEVIFLPGIACLWHIGRTKVVNRARMHVLYSGRVQGVGFRYTVKTVASGYEAVGTVRNLPDGRVELLAEGRKEELEAFRQGIRDAGLDHFIEKEDVRWGEATQEFRGFEIVK